jgi:hypothetical protein
LFVSLPFEEPETQRPDIGQIASREHSRSRWYRGDWCAVFGSISKIWTDLLFDITAGKTVIFLAIFTRENCPDVTCRKVIILFSFIPNECILARVCYSFFGRRIKITHVLFIADNCIKEEVHWQNNSNWAQRYEGESL